MSRDGLPRAYLRLDPNIDQIHPDLDTFIRLMCAAARQPTRGHFRDRPLLERLLGRAKVARLFSRGDVTELDDGRVYVAGWDEWQEGDLTVAERMRRMRHRRGKRDRVTPATSPSRNDVTTDASNNYVGNGNSRGVDVDVDSPPPPAKRGLRSEGTNPRRVGDNPRANGQNPRSVGESPRQEREAQKRGPSRVGEVMAEALRRQAGR